MRLSFLAIILLLTGTMVQAQLSNTKWQGNVNIPSETQVILDFKKDSVDMIIVDQGMVGESMTYSTSDSLITLKKTGGHSPCNMDDVFKLRYIIKDDKLFISNFSDPCDARGLAWTNEPFIRVKQ